MSQVRVYVPAERKIEIKKQFFEKYGRLPVPMCFKCRKKVNEMGVEVNLTNDTIEVYVRCHSDEEKAVAKIDKVLDPQTKIQWGGIAFIPKFGTRDGGVIIQPMNF